MINSIIEAISIALNKEFGDDYEIYMEEIKQDLKEPCFFVQCLNPDNNLFRDKRYFRTNPFCIQYFPKTVDEIQRECNDVAERMWQCLEYITIYSEDNPLRGTDENYEVIDGVLNFFVNYNLFLRKVEEETPMDDVSIKQNVKGGEE